MTNAIYILVTLIGFINGVEYRMDMVSMDDNAYCEQFIESSVDLPEGKSMMDEIEGEQTVHIDSKCLINRESVDIVQEPGMTALKILQTDSEGKIFISFQYKGDKIPESVMSERIYKNQNEVTWGYWAHELKIDLVDQTANESHFYRAEDILGMK